MPTLIRPAEVRHDERIRVLLRFSEALVSMASADIGISKNALKISTVIFDESGKYKDRDGVFVFAGFATFPVFLDVLVKEWLDCMLLAGLPHTSTSMKEAIVFRGPFESIRLDRDRRDCILRKLAHVIADNSDKLVHLASPLSRSTTEEFLKLPQQKREILRNDPYYAAFEACIKGALDVREDTQLHIVCDLAEQYSEECVSVFQQLRRMDERVKRRCLGIAFSDDDYYPLFKWRTCWRTVTALMCCINGANLMSPLWKNL